MKRQKKINTYGWNQVSISVYKVKKSGKQGYQWMFILILYDHLILSSAQLDTKANVSGLVSGDKLLEYRSEKKNITIEDLRDFLSSSP
jgi:hypothetical protein